MAGGKQQAKAPTALSDLSFVSGVLGVGGTHTVSPRAWSLALCREPVPAPALDPSASARPLLLSLRAKGEEGCGRALGQPAQAGGTADARGTQQGQESGLSLLHGTPFSPHPIQTV